MSETYAYCCTLSLFSDRRLHVDVCAAATDSHSEWETAADKSEISVVLVLAVDSSVSSSSEESIRDMESSMESLLWRLHVSKTGFPTVNAGGPVRL